MDVLADLLGHARSIVELREQIRQILERTARSSRLPPILLQGETGTGKGLVAHVIHRAGPRGTGPFVDVNCAAIPETLLEAELFGFERGAFTDAQQPKAGLFQSAHAGTIFLDEIALLPEPLQAKFLQVIEDRSVRRLGSTHSEPVDVLIIAATNDDLLAATQARRFREDLYHRLAVLTLRLPPLRERRDDIMLLAEHFLEHACRDYGLPPKVLTSAAGAALCAYPWPGNVRELANVMERVALLVETSHIGPAMLDLPGEAVPVVPASAAATTSGSSLDARVEAWERDELRSALHETRWNVARAAVRLGITRGTIRYRIGKYALEPPAPHGRRRGTSGVSTPRPSPPPALPPPAVTQWERRLVALLHVTVCPRNVTEDSLAEFGRHLDVVVQKVESFAGRIEEAGPSRLVAAFGLDPVEDAPRRAALAAMAIQNALGRVRQSQGRRTAVTIAIHADQCPVGAVSGRAQVDTDAKRPMMMVLEELDACAGPDTILVSRAARWLLGPRFDFDERDEGDDGGASRGLRLLGYSQHRFGLGGHPAPFVGREHELRVLQTLWQQALQQRGQAVAVVGEPGIGKSRLLFEFRRALGAGPLTYLEGRGESYGGGNAYQPVIELLKGYFHIDERDDPLAAGEKVKAQLLALDQALESDLPAFLALLEAPGTSPSWQALEPPQRRQRTLDALRHLVVRLSQEQPVLLAIEDLHWIDTETEAFLHRLISSLPAARLLVFVSYRPEYQHSWGSTTSYTQLHLDPLQTVSAEALAGSLVGHDIALQPLRRLLIERAEGNPFFLEESVRSLIESRALVGERGAYRPAQDLHTLQVPPTVRAVLASRIDRLPPEEKQVLHAAAVLGKDVSYSLLQAITEGDETALRTSLGRLQAAEFLYEVQVLAVTEYSFKHALTHEVAYGGLLRDRRRVLHARLIEAIEQLRGDRLAEEVERLAHHAVRAEAWEKAATYLRRAGAKAVGRSAYREAAGYFEQALAALKHLPESRETREEAIDLRLDLRNALLPLGEFERIFDLLRDTEPLAQALDDQWRLGQIAAYLTAHFSIAGKYDQAIASGQRTLAIAKSLDDFALRAQASARLGVAYKALGDYPRAIEILGRTLASLAGDRIGERFGMEVPLSIFSRSALVECLAELGRFAEAIACAEEAVHIAEAIDQPLSFISAWSSIGELYLFKGDFHKAIPAFERSLELCQIAEIRTLVPFIASALGWAHALSGRIAGALPLLEQAVEQATSMGRMAYHSLRVGWLSEAYLLAGRTEKAVALALRALDLSQIHKERGHQAWIVRLLGEIAAQGDPPEFVQAADHFRQAMVRAEELGMRPLVARCHLGLGMMCGRDGKEEQARGHLAAAATMFREMGMQFWLDKAQAEVTMLR